MQLKFKFDPYIMIEKLIELRENKERMIVFTDKSYIYVSGTTLDQLYNFVALEKYTCEFLKITDVFTGSNWSLVLEIFFSQKEGAEDYDSYQLKIKGRNLTIAYYEDEEEVLCITTYKANKPHLFIREQ